MITMLEKWQGAVEVDGQSYDSMQSFRSVGKQFNGEWHIKLLPKSQNAHTELGKSNNHISEVSDKPVYRITVKAYMTKPATPEFDFMQKWNNNVPMPLRTMVGTIEKETRGMYFMNLHGQGLEEICCLRCGRRLTHPVSRHYGIGPECMSKLGIIANIEDVDEIKEKLVDIKWTGWVIKSAITEQEEV